MKKWKQALALVLALVMALSLVALPSFAEGEETGGGTETTQPVWPAEGSIKLDKDAKAVEGSNNLWEVTLGIQGKNYKTTSDVVLVIDCSGSMEGTKLANTQKAAKAFGDKLLTENSATRIAIVTYSGDAAAYSNGRFYTADELSAFKTAVDDATYANGGTNQQAGIHVAQQLLASDSSTGRQKNIVILSDGAATYSHPFIVPRNGSAPTTPAPDYTKKIGSGGDFEIGYYGGFLGLEWYDQGNAGHYSGSSYNDKGSYTYNADGTFTFKSNVNTNNGVATIWEANQAKAAGTTIFSVALQAGTNGENTLKSCATDAAKGYFAIGQNDNVEQKLTAAFEAIAGSIAIAASNGSVADTMGDKVQLSFSGAAPVITNDKAVYDAGNADVYISQGSATYDTTNRQINWNVGNVREGDNPIMKYKVTVKEGCNPHTGEVLDANKEATFSYKNYLGEDTVGTFPVPQVTVGGGNILVHYYLVNDQGQPINENGAVVESPALAKQVKTAAYHEENGSTGLSYNIPYTVSHDNVANYNYFGSYILNDSNLTKGDSVDVTLTAANSNQHVWFAYYQTFNVVHVRMDENGAAKTVQTDTYTVSASFNLTDKVNKDKDGNAVTEGTYLYGGAFNDPACTEAYPFANEGETGLSFAPKAGETYYIWEVPNAYLIPKALVGWEHNQDNKLDVIAFYMMAGIDREYYAGVGFTVNGEDKLSNQNTLIDYSTGDNQGKTKVVSLTPGQSAGFQSVELKRKDGNTQTYTVTNVVPGYDKGFIACYGLAQADWKNTDVTTTYTPYWITLDGVKVTSGVTRTATYQGVGYQRLKTEDTGDAGDPVYAKNTQTATRLMTFASYLADSTPIAQETPTVENVTVTVRDSNKTTQVEIPCGTSARDQISYQAPAGKVFAGWFTDEACTTPANLDSITQDTTIYAKYVSDSYLDLHYVRNGLFRLRGVTLISAVDDPANYQESGIIVDGVKVSVAYANRYRLFYTASGLFGAARNAKLMITQQSLSGSGTLEVTPYWVTKDGTTVLGENHTLHYNTRTIWK